VGWWGEDGCEKILGGRDVVGGGTWMGCTKNGRLAFLTNVLEPDSETLPSAKTRGDLPLRFLQVYITLHKLRYHRVTMLQGLKYRLIPIFMNGSNIADMTSGNGQ